MKRIRLAITGVVQGVGFRPAVYRLATEMGLNGYVLNNSRGVVIEVEGGTAEGFADTLLKSLPPLAVVNTLSTETLPPIGHTTFEIRLSEKADGAFALVAPDIATCGDCVAETLDPADRRHKYPFTNCVNCGPRYSIVQGVPYDRPLTTMRSFAMCPSCKAEYDDPADRRFHAQPTACPACGPKIAYIENGRLPEGEPVMLAVQALKAGKVVAIKGLGGFHLGCDASNREAVRRLRERKRKNQKPFALMARDIDTVKRYCEVSPAEEALLSGTVRPIVLLKSTPYSKGRIADDVAPGGSRLGFMLPYTPLHHLLFHGHDHFDALVMTSGNLSEEPIVIDNDEALDRLSVFADSFLLHDRDIYMRVDDSVARVVRDAPRLMRRARGYVPEPIDMGFDMPDILACGGELKNTFCVTKGRYAIQSQHIGDLTSGEALDFYAETLKNLKRTFSAEPKVVAHDMHPDYLSARFAKDYAAEHGGLTLVPVQHHHAHIAACMAENGFDGKVIGVAFDGTGYGTDGGIWGSEFLIADYRGFERMAHINYIPLPGGDAAVREPWRIAVSLLVMAYGKEASEILTKVKGEAYREKEVGVILRMMERGINSPPSCGMGRLFDGVSALLGLREVITYEGEAAIALEMAAEGVIIPPTPYPYTLVGENPVVIDTRPTIRAVVDDIIKGRPKGGIAARFHSTVADMVFRVCGMARERTSIGTVALSGGVFQNALLFTSVEAGLMERGFRTLSHSRVPCNDGCVSLGQAAVAAALWRDKC